MGTAAPRPRCSRLRQTLAGSTRASARARRGCGASQVGLAAPIDAALGGGLACGALHELAPAAPLHLGAASGFALALAARAGRRHGGEMLWIATDFARREGGAPYGPGLDLFGLAVARLLVLRVPRAGRCAVGDGGGAALPRARLRRRRTDRRGRRGRSHRDAPALARRARRRQRRHSGLACSSAIAPRRCRARRRPAGRSPPRRASPIAYGGLGRTALRPLAPQEPARTRPAGGSSSGIIMSVSSSRRYLSVWLRRLSTDRIERRSARAG